MITKLIEDRKNRLSLLTFEQAMLRLAGGRDKLADISQAVKYNEETDQQVLKRFGYVYCDCLAELPNGWYKMENKEGIIL